MGLCVIAPVINWLFPHHEEVYMLRSFSPKLALQLASTILLFQIQCTAAVAPSIWIRETRLST